MRETRHAWGDFHARLCFTRSSIPEEKWGLLVVYIKEGWVEEGLAQSVCAWFSVWEVPRSIPRCDLKSLNSWVLFLSIWLVKTHKTECWGRERWGLEFMSTPSASDLLLLKMTISSCWSKKWFFYLSQSHTKSTRNDHRFCWGSRRCWRKPTSVV